jgi:hypothetical protein
MDDFTNEKLICDQCGSEGAIDFITDLLCQKCADEIIKEYSNSPDDN